MKWLFGETCSLWYCFRKPWRYLQISACGLRELIPYCEEHSKIVDELFREGEIKTSIPTDYEPLKEPLTH